MTLSRVPGERQGVTFAQAEGVESLPNQLALREISPALSAVLWAVMHEVLDDAIGHSGVYGGSYYLSDPWKTILRMWWITRLYKNADEFPEPHEILEVVKRVITSKDYIKTFDLLQFIMNRPECPINLPKTIGRLLERTKSAYRVIDKHIVPISSDEQASAVKAALVAAQNSAAKGVYAHLQSATRALSSGDWSQSIRESIHAVEASAKAIEPSAATLGPALERLKQTIGLHPALSKAYSSLYGYSSDEKGIRHALVFEEAAKVGEREAIFMFGACASFVSYLLSIAKEVK